MNNTESYGPLILRVSLGIVLIAHSLYLKLMVFGLPGTASFLKASDCRRSLLMLYF